ncbi:hypothetical protein PCCS19_45170 [Paenibacillus sp. CCS19]|nr:hypothetical protein PCCS19_45170 [Paenibacillus cellulosilyticus]
MRKHILLSGVLAVLLLGAGFAAYGKVNNGPTKQTLEEGWTEPEFAGAGNASVSVRYPKNLQAIVDSADTIISGEIVSINDTSNTLTMEEDTPERAVTEKFGVDPSYTVNGRDIVISVSDTLKGRINGEEATLNIYNVDVNLDPEVQVGDSYILFLNRDEKTGKYHSAHFSAGYFKMDKTDKMDKSKEKIHPLYSKAPEFAALENQTYEIVKQKIKEKVK